MKTERRAAAFGATIAIATAAVYLRALDVGFFSDDYQWLGRMNATLERPGYLFTVFYRDFNPVLHASFALDWLLAGATPWVWHADSILLHAAASVLLFVLCLRLGAALPVAAAASLLWACNVRLSEAVIWPAARGHQFAALCSLAALVWILRPPGGRRWPALLFLTAGLFAKETTLFAMAAIPFFLPDWSSERRLLAGLACLGGGFVLLNVMIKSDLHTSGAGLGALLLKTPFILLRPLGLGDYYRFDVFSLLLVGVAFGALAWWLRRGAGLAGLVWVLACSAPIVPLDKLSSRYLYLPAIGWSVVFCAAWTSLAPRMRSESLRRAVPLAVAAGMVLVLAANVLLVQREIGDYRLLARPYDALVDRFAPALESLEPNTAFAVLDAAPQTTIPELAASVHARGNIVKLIPYRRHAIDGLIELPDLLNVARPRRPGTLGRPLAAADDETLRWFRYDGRGVAEIPPPAVERLPAERLHRAAWDDAGRYFRRQP